MGKKAISYLVFFGLLLGGFYYAMVKYTDFEEVKDKNEHFSNQIILMRSRLEGIEEDTGVLA